MVLKQSYFIIFFLFVLGQFGTAQVYNPKLDITTLPKDIASKGYVDYKTSNVPTYDARFTLLGDGYFDLRNKFDHQFPQNSKGFSTNTYFIQRYKKKGPIIRTKTTGVTGPGTTSNNKIRMPIGANTRIGSSWLPCNNIDNYFMLIFENTSSVIDKGCVEFYYDDTEVKLNGTGILDYGWAKYKSKKSVTGSSLYTHKLTWEYDKLKPGEQRVIYIPMMALKSVNTKINLGSKLESGCAGNGGISNGSYLTSGYPHDPNKKIADKTCVYPNRPDQQTITYTIRFQNEGDAPANDVILKDVLDILYLDTTTLEFVESEHAYNYSLTGGLLQIDFPNIKLPGLKQSGPETYSYDDTESYIIFKICTYSNLPTGKILNQAEIIFDTQLPIFTNVSEVDITIECGDPLDVCAYGFKPTSTSKSIAHDIKIMPNPVEDVLIIKGLEDQSTSVIVVNNRGEIVESKSGISKQNNTINISDLPSGLYFIQIRNDFLNITEKVIKI